tara:strand:+ start:19 stop:300 length:282 start_codon:yes stop_codon:yes gene_type:complete
MVKKAGLNIVTSVGKKIFKPKKIKAKLKVVKTTKPKTTKPKTTKPKTTKPKNTFVPTTQKLPTTQQDNTKTKYGGQPSDTPTFVLGRFTGLNL